MADSTRRDINKRVTALIIHGFTIAHVVAAGILGPAAGSVLAPMTGAMVIAIGAQCSAGFSVKKALKVMANFVGFILGVSIAEFLVGLIPGIGNIANAIATGIVTEILGWATYIVLRDGLEEKGNLSFWDKIQLLLAAIRLREDNKEFTQKLKDARQKMTNDERTKYDNFMRIITDRNSSKDERADALYGADILLKPYGVSIGFAA